MMTVAVLELPALSHRTIGLRDWGSACGTGRRQTRPARPIAAGRPRHHRRAHDPPGQAQPRWIRARPERPARAAALQSPHRPAHAGRPAARGRRSAVIAAKLAASLSELVGTMPAMAMTAQHRRRTPDWRGEVGTMARSPRRPARLPDTEPIEPLPSGDHPELRADVVVLYTRWRPVSVV